MCTVAQSPLVFLFKSRTRLTQKNPPETHIPTKYVHAYKNKSNCIMNSSSTAPLYHTDLKLYSE